MRFIVHPDVADQFRDGAGNLPDNFMIWDGGTFASSPDVGFITPDLVALGGRLVDEYVDRLLASARQRGVYLPVAPKPKMAPPPPPAPIPTVKGKRIAQWKQERSGRDRR